MLYGLKPSIVGKRLPIKQIQKLLSTHIKQHMPIKVVMDKDPKHEAGLVYVGGTYYADSDTDGLRQVEIVFSYNTNSTTIKMSDARWSRMCNLFADTILHEVIHMRQYRTRGFKQIPGYESTAYYARDRREQEYYGHKDEMGAFAFNIACEMIDRFGYEPTVIKQYMDTNTARRHRNTWWCDYLKNFNWNHDHRIIRRMKLKIMHQLENASIGKPFKTNEWLTH
jgi:hypothetical protein